MRITMIGHSTVLIEAAGKRILTDPFFGLHGNPAYARTRPPARKREELTDIDLVLVSHNHWDHTDRKFFQLLSPSVPVFAPAITAWMTRLKGARHVTGLKPWQRTELDGLTITAVPAYHVTFTVGYVLEAEGKRIYFAGDTYLGKFMERIGRELRPDVALVPVTTFRIPMTMGETQAVEGARWLTPEVVIPIHLGIAPRFPLLRTHETPENFRELAAKAGLIVNVVILNESESWSN